MKKFFLMAALFVLAGTSAFAQFGIRAGLNFSKLSKDMSDLTEAKTGFHAGLVYNIDLIGGFSVQPGIYYSSKAYTTDASESLNSTLGTISSLFSTEKFSVDGTANYIEVPVLVKYSIPVIEDKLSIDTHVGPYFAYGISGKYKWSNDDITNTLNTLGVESEYEIFKDTDDEGVDQNRFDVGLQLGLGVNLLKKFYVGYDCDLGLKKIDNEGSWMDTDNLETKNLTHMITVGVYF